MARNIGLVHPRSQAKVPSSSIHRILRNRVYTGEFEWLGVVYKGRREALISKDLWLMAQDVMDGRVDARIPRTGGSAYAFAFSGLVSCGHCGCALTAEIKKGRYIYYHCTQYKGKCPKKYVREEVMAEQFAAILSRLKSAPGIHDLIVRALKSSFATEREEHELAVTRLTGEIDRLGKRIEAVYTDKLDGKISAEYYKRASSQWQDEMRRCHDELRRYQEASEAYMNEGVDLLILARDAEEIFQKHEGASRKRLLNLVLSNCTWKDAQLSANFRKPFDLILENTTSQHDPKSGDGYDDAGKENWLGN